MPILTIEIVGELEPEIRSELARRLADAAGQVLGSPPHGTWVRLHVLAVDDYSENGGLPPDGALPIFVSVLQAEPVEGERLERQLRQLAAAIARVAGRPVERVHIILEPPASGRIAFGGSLRL